MKDESEDKMRVHVVDKITRTRKQHIFLGCLCFNIELFHWATKMQMWRREVYDEYCFVRATYTYC